MLDKFYPSIATLITSEDFPQGLGFLENIADSILQDLFYKNLRIVTSTCGDRGIYEFTLICYNRIEQRILDTDLKVVFNTSEIPNEGSEFFLRFSYQVGILKYLPYFNMQSFDWSGRSFFNLAISITEENQSSILKETINVFIPDDDTLTDKIDAFIDSYNTKYTDKQITVNVDPDEDVYIQNILDSLDAEDVDILDVIYNDYIFSANFIDLLANIENLCYQFIGFMSIESLKQLFIPKISASLDDLSLAIEFPRRWLKPIDSQTNEVIEDENIKSMLRFNVGNLHFSTENGFTFENESALSFDKSEIGNTGLTLFFNQMKLDLSSNTNIPEATAAGYPDNFKGVFVQEAVIGLPSKWFNSVENTTQKKMNIFPIRNKQEYCKKKSVFLLILFFITYSKTNHLKIYCFC